MMEEEVFTMIADSLGFTFGRGIDFRSHVLSVLTPIREIVNMARNLRSHRLGHSGILRAADINEALFASNLEILLGYSDGQDIEYVEITEPGAYSQILAPRDEQVNLRRIFSANLGDRPTETSVEFHWLAIDGIQPAIPENVAPIQTEIVTPEEMNWKGDRTHSWRDSNAVIAEDLKQIFANTLTKIKHEKDISDVLEELRTSGVLQVLLPFFIRYLTDAMAMNMKKPKNVLRLLEVANALFGNESLELGENVHHFLSIVMSPMLYDGFCDDEVDLQYSVREECAAFLGLIVDKFKGKYPSMMEKVTQKLGNVLFSNEAGMCAQYGAVYGIMSLGENVASNIIIQNLAKLLEMAGERMKTEDRRVIVQGMRLRAALMNAKKIFVVNCL